MILKRRNALFLSVLLILTACVKKQANENDPPNILIVTSDDLNYNSVGAFGCNIPGITPNIDRLASEGMRFTNAHSNTAVCMPCRQSWMTGQFPHNTDSEGFEALAEDVPTLPEQLKKRGYINGILGKEIHHQPRERFFWDFIPFVQEDDSTWRHGKSRNPNLFYEYSKKFFEQAKQEDKPFFFLANSHDPHRPFIGNDSATWGRYQPPVDKEFSPDEIEMLGYLPDIPKVRKEVAQYYGNVYRSDQSIGSVLRALKEAGLEENTVIFYMSDHGAAFPFGKSQCYLNSTKTPLIVKWPGKITPGSVDSTHFVNGIDLMPTVLNIVGLPEPTELDGSSYLSLLLGNDQDEREYAFTTYYQIYAKIRYPMRAIQDDEFGYIYNFWADHERDMRGDAMGGITWKAMVEAAEDDPEIAERVELYKYRVPEEFYNFKKDPNGLVNLANDPEYADIIERYRAVMLDRMQRYHDPAYEAFRDRNEPGVIADFMAAQREKAKNTKPFIRF